jgi:transposase
MMPAPTQVWLVVEPIDMRAGIEGLSQRIQATLWSCPRLMDAITVTP